MATQKELFIRIAEFMNDDEEVVEFCNKKIAQIENRKPSPRKPSQETVEMRAAILTYLSEQASPVTAATVGEAMGISARSASGMLRYLVEADKVIPVDSTKKSAPKEYVIA